MQRRPGIAALLVSALVLVALMAGMPARRAAWLGGPCGAVAQDRPVGAVTVLALIGEERAAADGSADTARTDYGAGAMADLYYQSGVLRFGGALGLAAVSSADGVRSRVYMPVAGSISAHLPLGASLGLDLRVRAGLWAGATDTGVDADLFGSFGGWMTFAIGGGAHVALGLDVWLQRAELQPDERGLALYFSPGLGLVWTPRIDPTAEVVDSADADTLGD